MTRFARSAPLMPTVPRAILSRSTSAARGTLRVWTLRISSRPFLVGRSTVTWRSNRPGRSRAGSSTSGRLVAASTITLSLGEKPSISVRIWLSVCSRSSCPPPSPAPRTRPTASISSMNRMQGLFSLAVLNMSRTRLAPTPTNIWMNSEPEIEKKRHARLAGDRPGQQRLAGARRTDPAARPWESGRRAAETSRGSSGTRRSPAARDLAFSSPATSSNVVRCFDLSCRLAGLLTKLPRIPPSNWSRARRIIR